MQKNWYALTQKQIFDELQTSLTGLDLTQVAQHRNKYGANKLPEDKQPGLWTIFWRQFQSPLIYILLIASVIVLFFQEYADAGVILCVLFFNALAGTFQEGKAQSALNSLSQLVKTQAVVIRNGEENVIDDSEVVVGDIILLQEGDKVPADMRLLTADNLKVDEAALTGESVPVHKVSGKLNQALLETSDMKNMVFTGTNVRAGRALAVVVAVGVSTIIGGISQTISKIDTEDPIKRDVRKLSKTIIVMTSLIVSFLFLYGVFTGRGFKEMFTISVSMIVSLIPEGLPVVLTLVLATGVWRMSRKNALVKKLQAVESLGQASVLALDKTGTITKNEMVVEKIYLDDEIYSVSGSGYEPAGKVTLNDVQSTAKNNEKLKLLGQTIAACTTAEARYIKEQGSWQVLGDPTEAAVALVAEKLGIDRHIMDENYKRIADMPFTYEDKYHASLRKFESDYSVSVIGAPETVLNLSEYVYFEGERKKITEREKKILENALINLTKQGLRVVAIATKAQKKSSLGPDDVKNLTFLAFAGMRDAIRPEARQSIEIAKRAGLKVIMITGDHKATAQAVAEEVGIFSEGDKVLTGHEIEMLSDEGLSTMLNRVTVFARVSPEHKMQIIQAYRDAGETIAMTGDGVNDAPPLVAADLGVAMGKIGTEVAKGVADIILLDDNFGSIVTAVEEGRSIYKTIKKVILYLFSTSLGEVMIIAVSMLMGLPLPIVASQIIWLNFVTDGFLTVAVAMEPKELGLLTKRSLIRHNSFIDGIAVQRMVIMALPMVVGSLWIFTRYMDGDYVKASTMALTAMAVFQWMNAWNCRFEKKSIFSASLFTNRHLIFATATVAILQILAVYHPILQNILNTTALTIQEWTLIVAASLSIIIFEEIRKYVHRAVTA